MKQKITFPEGFLWGAAVSAYQTEGGNTNTDWWAWEHSQKRIEYLKNAGKNPEDYQSGIACDSYHRYDEDFALAQQLHHNCIRISIEWARIEPEEGVFSEEALVHYEKVLQSAKDHGLQTFVTLHHFSLPLWFANKGGFSKRANMEKFVAYVGAAASRLHPLVDFWITINEPEIYSVRGYLIGEYPPNKKSMWGTLRIVRNLIRAHKQASITLHEISDTPVGMADQLTDIQASNFWAQPVATLVRYVATRYILDRAIRYSDFIGVNYYLRQSVNWRGFQKKESEDYEISDLGWELYPRGIQHILVGLKKYHKPIYITENGVADAKDLYREKYIRDHLYYIHTAIKQGADVRGYLHWSLIDNFEWSDGFAPRFGLIEINRQDSLRRIVRPSAYAYADICKNNSMEY
jgi:beta-glucosidase